MSGAYCGCLRRGALKNALLTRDSADENPSGRAIEG